LIPSKSIYLRHLGPKAGSGGTIVRKRGTWQCDIFSKPLHCRCILYLLSHQGSPINGQWLAKHVLFPWNFLNIVFCPKKGDLVNTANIFLLTEKVGRK